MVSKLARALEKYDKVFLFMEKDEVHRHFMKRFCASDALAHNEKKVLILSTEEFTNGRTYVCHRLTREKAQRLKEFYFLYEFSDRFKLLSWEDGFGSIVNYVETGILTWEEAFTAILH